MTSTTPSRTGSEDPNDRRIRRTWRLLLASLAGVLLLVAWRVALGTPPLVDLVTAGLVLAAGYAAVLHRAAFQALEDARRGEIESFARILRGLSRSVSPDAMIEAIVDDLAVGTGADHIVVVRRRPEVNALEATLVSRRPGLPNSTTLLPLSDLEDPGEGGDEAEAMPVAVPIRADPAPVPMNVARPVPVLYDTAVSAAASAPSAVRDAVVAVRDRAPDHAPTVALGATGSFGPTSLGRAAEERVAERIASRVRAAYGLKHTLAAPLRGERGMIGAIVISRRTAAPWPAAARRILAGAADEASAALTRAFSHRDAEARASTDALTGLPNRRYFDEFCGLLARRRRAEDAVGVLMVDIDRFKSLNDSHGHATGDEVLRAVGTAIAAAVREDDVPARYGGEEFAVLLRNPTPDTAVEVGERVREAVGRLDLRRLGVPGVTVSVGVAVGGPKDRPIAELVEDADRALYQAKRRGRDRVVAA